MCHCLTIKASKLTLLFFQFFCRIGPGGLQGLPEHRDEGYQQDQQGRVISGFRLTQNESVKEGYKGDAYNEGCVCR